jgi:hypothetical protein
MLGDCRPVRLAQALCQIDRAKVRMGLHSSEPWCNRLGVKTGDPLSPILFLVFMHELSSSMIFSLKKCEIVEYGAVLTDRVRK